MNPKRLKTSQRLVVLGCLIALLAPAAALGEGSITFNGTSSPSGGTSKLENDSADVLDGSDRMSITAWVKATGTGETGFGQVLVLDPAGDIRLQHHSGSGSYGFIVEWSTDEGQWTFGALDSAWRCIQVTYDKSDINADPDIYVDGAQYKTHCRCRRDRPFHHHGQLRHDLSRRGNGRRADAGREQD